jgi:hypothetical protein
MKTPAIPYSPARSRKWPSATAVAADRHHDGMETLAASRVPAPSAQQVLRRYASIGKRTECRPCACFAGLGEVPTARGLALGRVVWATLG